MMLYCKKRKNDLEIVPLLLPQMTDRWLVFFCFSVKLHTNEGMLKFVVIDNTMRNKGYGCEMLKLAIKYAFEIAKADAVHLNVFRKILVRRNVMKKWDLRKER